MKKLLTFFVLILVNTSLAGCLVNKSKTAQQTPANTQTVTPDQPSDTESNSDASQDQDENPSADSSTTFYESTETHLIPRGIAIKKHQSNENILSITDSAFFPQVLTIKPGTKVTWINTSHSPHSLMSKENLFFSAVLMPGDSFSYIYPEQGIYNYYNGINSGMVGTILAE